MGIAASRPDTGRRGRSSNKSPIASSRPAAARGLGPPRVAHPVDDVEVEYVFNAKAGNRPRPAPES
ncbi:hypothetical protein MSG_00590 [Mycobacterium shigaense]|uniref:Uncharacterized protein n=1 Tax=Mycobacterium shigaense TaxID=722731 RepID=A0A1Z4ECR7_9MYCO|nr:hypothetical protein B2J96_00825 [Mycobacterium shigaense]BAX90754.1 hypothetical protein MSG_00590 [Mycobacterium shigaense]